MKNQKIGRKVVRSEPTVLFAAEEACVLYCFVPRTSLDGFTENPAVVVGIGSIPWPYGGESCPILPIDREFLLHLEAGDVVMAVSAGDSLVSYSAIPERAR
jgi:hypothetical protein